MTARHWQCALSWALAAVLGEAGGCSARPVAEPIAGHVWLDGAPLEDAVIVFVPLDRKAPQHGGAVAEGQFELAGGDGLPPGRYRVEFYEAPPPEFCPQQRPPARRRRVSLPGQHHRRSQQTIEVRAGSPNAFDFELTSTGSP